MQFTDLNRAVDIGANCYLLELGPFKILVDAGVHPKKIGWDATPQLDFLRKIKLDAVILTHCHLDHLGALPIVAQRQPQALILTTMPSKVLAPRLLANSVQVMKMQAEQEAIPDYPLYTHDDVEALSGRLIAISYGKKRTLQKAGESLELTFYPAGHVIGAAGCMLEYKKHRIFLTADVLFRNQCTLAGATFPEGPCETLIIETTRGATPAHPDVNREAEMARLVNSIATTLSGGGSYLIPAFALGRMQEILSILHAAKKEKRLPSSAVYCSGLGMALADHFELIAQKTHLLTFSKKMLRELHVQPLKTDLVPGKDLRPAIYLLSSGMLAPHTPAYLVAASLLPHAHNRIGFVGYCDPDTPGGELQRTQPGADMGFEHLDFTCSAMAPIERFDLSGHADRDEIIHFTKNFAPKTVILTHGEIPAREWMKSALHSALPEARVIDPIPGKTVELVEG